MLYLIGRYGIRFEEIISCRLLFNEGAFDMDDYRRDDDEDDNDRCIDCQEDDQWKCICCPFNPFYDPYDI